MRVLALNHSICIMQEPPAPWSLLEETGGHWVLLLTSSCSLFCSFHPWALPLPRVCMREM